MIDILRLNKAKINIKNFGTKLSSYAANSQSHVILEILWLSKTNITLEK